ncbi:hypothetical protein PAMC26577_00915 [Caballeronia sordidicola]|uniref:Uncharacterized protein n=1 Tax=Caballeronia sordidicola TaxID=196367 RepID=A0A242N8H3_CABSO|nr:hypothetical protein PAMC26577_00915 [Caballeronia sordidicola]
MGYIRLSQLRKARLSVTEFAGVCMVSMQKILIADQPV